MAVLFVIQYDVTNPDLYAKYNPGSLDAAMTSLADVGGEAVAAGARNQMEGDGRHVAVALRFPDEGSIQKWLDHPVYAEARAIREASTGNYSTFTVDVIE